MATVGQHKKRQADFAVILQTTHCTATSKDVIQLKLKDTETPESNKQIKSPFVYPTYTQYKIIYV